MKNLASIHFLRSAFLETESFHQDIVVPSLQMKNQECDEMPDHYVPEDSFQSLPDWSEALFAVGNIIVLISSICGNIGALLVLYKSQVSKRSTKLFLVSLALCDLSLTITSPTVDLSQLLSRYQAWIFGDFLCRMIPFVQTTAVMGVGLFLVVIAAERYMYVVRAFESPISTSPWRDIYATITVTAMWICALLIALPNVWYYQRDSFWTYIIVNGEKVRPRNETCKMYYICLRTTFDHRNIAYYSFLGMAILIPTICFLFCYISIIIFVRRHVNVMSASITTTTTATFPSQSPGPEQRIARNKKTLRLILGLIFLNLTCRLPVWLFVVITNIKETPVNTLTLFMLYGFHLLSNVNCLINPFVYAIFNDSIRSTRGRGPNCGGGPTPHRDRASCCNFMSWSCCYHKIKASSVEYFLERRGKQNNYDFTTKNNSKFLPSISTQRFNLSDKNEFATPKLSSATTTNNINSS